MKSIRKMRETVAKEIRDPFEDLREKVETMSGQRSGFPPLKKLGPTASDDDRNRVINEIIDRLEGRG